MNYKIYIAESIKYILRSYPFIRKEVKDVERLYKMSAEERHTYENEAFLQTFRIAIRKSPFYRKLYGDAGITENDIKSLSDLEKLPIITKNQIRQCSEQLLTQSVRILKKSHTSGTTGEPLTIYDNWKVHRLFRAYNYCYYKKLGFVLGKDRHVSLRGFLQRSDIKLNLHIAKTLFLSSYNIRQETARQYYHHISVYKPKAISGYPNSLYNLALLFESKGWRLNIPLCFTSSETLYDFHRHLISKVFGCDIYDIYGNSEHVCILYEGKEHNGYFKAPGSGTFEIEDDGILATSFINNAWPLIRYKMNDLMQPSYDCRSTSFNQSIIIKSLYGRTSNCIILKNGSHLGAAALSFLFKDTHHIKISQLIQQEDGFVDINIVPDLGFSDLDINIIKKSIQDRLGLNAEEFGINIIKPDQIMYSDSNKFSLIISKYKQ